MSSRSQRVVVDEKGKKRAVLPDIEDYQKILRDLEELETIRAYDRAKSSGDEAVPFEEAVAEIEPSRR
ncbi:hypothetical protein MYX82_06990 [Acidobacteria bacterium AH-259-D05]|nr:hypothetical protein [Acidobacteria bacterium AH-259-D05]